MSVSGLIHTVEGDVTHAYEWVVGEAPKVEAEVETVILKVETYIGTNKVLSELATPVENALKSEAANFVNEAKAAVAAGTPVSQTVTTIAADFRAAGSTILSNVETQVAPVLKTLEGSGTALQMALNVAWAAFGPNIESFVLGLL